MLTQSTLSAAAKELHRFFLLLAVVLSICVLASCGKHCKEKCEEDDECMAGFSCLDTSDSGKVCLPSECRTCFDNNDTCRMDQEYEGDYLKCDFTECY